MKRYRTPDNCSEKCRYILRRGEIRLTLLQPNHPQTELSWFKAEWRLMEAA